MPDTFREHYIGKLVRQIFLSISNLEEGFSMQFSPFEVRKWENRKIGAAMDNIRNRYGYVVIYREVSKTEAGTAVARTKLIGGHKK